MASRTRSGVGIAFADYIEFLVNTRSIVEYTQVWWSIRPHFAFGTVEVRICDAQATAAESEALAALIVACVAQAAREIDAGVPFDDIPGRLIEENLWRAVRYGLDGELLDLQQGEPYPAAVALERLLEWTAPARAELGIEVALPAMNGAQRQRGMLESGMSLSEGYVRHGGRANPRYVCCAAGKHCGSEPMSTDPTGQPRKKSCALPTRPRSRRSESSTCCSRTSCRWSTSGCAGPAWRLARRTSATRPQVRLIAIEAVRALLPLIEQTAPPQANARIRDAVSQLQLAYACGSAAPPRPAGAGDQPTPGEPGGTPPAVRVRRPRWRGG